MVRSDSGKIHVLHAFDETHGLVALAATQDGPDLSRGMDHSGFPAERPHAAVRCCVIRRSVVRECFLELGKNSE